LNGISLLLKALEYMTVKTGRTSSASQTATLKVGDAAPDFDLKSHDGGSRTLSGYAGNKNVVLAFYPFAFSDV